MSGVLDGSSFPASLVLAPYASPSHISLGRGRGLLIDFLEAFCFKHRPSSGLAGIA